MSNQPLRILIIGAHPDDADIKAGGTAARWCALGHEVQLVSVTNGQAGHQSMAGPELVKRRRAEAQSSASVIGATYLVMDIPDGELDGRLEYRHQIIRLIRTHRPDLIITHRCFDYHPDHRFTGQLLQDASYLLTVPAICSDVRHLDTTPVICSFSDNFKKPCRFEPHVIVDIDEQFEKVIDMLDRHVSQFYEWLPYNAGNLDQVPSDATARRSWLHERMSRRVQNLTNRLREEVVAVYGERGSQIKHIEAFEVSEYGAPLDAEMRAKLFPFIPAATQAKSFSRKDWVDLPEDD